MEKVLGNQPDIFLRLQELADSAKVTKCNFEEGSRQVVRVVAPSITDVQVVRWPQAPTMQVDYMGEKGTH